MNEREHRLTCNGVVGVKYVHNGNALLLLLLLVLLLLLLLIAVVMLMVCRKRRSLMRG